jgi:hypothetical protein
MASRETVASSKFVAVDALDNELPYPYDDRWSLQRTTGPARLIIAPRRGSHVDVLLELARRLPEPFGVLYLLSSRTGEHRDGRYRSPEPTNRKATEAFVQGFREYFEGDGRHHVWLTSLPDAGTLVYDNHDVIYAYGPLDRYREVLVNRAFREASVTIPVPHQHRFNEEFDDAERKLIDYWEWRHTPFRPEDHI